MRKLIGFLLICLLAWQTYEQITFLSEKDSKVEAFYLTRSIGAQSVYVPHIDNWRDLELEERDKIVKEALKTNTDPSTEEVNEYIEKMRAL